MSRRIAPIVKKPLDVYDDMMTGYADPSAAGPKSARKYLERVLEQNQNIPNAVKFFLYDLLSEACAQLDDSETAREYAAAAHGEPAYPLMVSLSNHQGEREGSG